MMRVPDPDRWKPEALAKISATPWHMRAAALPEVVFQEKEKVPETVATPDTRDVRRIYIKQEDLETYGHTRGCPRCESALRYGYGKTTKSHTDICRKRIMGKLVETPQCQLRIARLTQRMDHFVAEHIGKVYQQGQL